MTTPYDVPASQFIEKLAKYLRENVDDVQPPAWASMVKTGTHVEKQPQNPNWWYIRSASILRKVYVHGPIGLERLRADYGGRKDFGVKPEQDFVTMHGEAVRKGSLCAAWEDFLMGTNCFSDKFQFQAVHKVLLV